MWKAGNVPTLQPVAQANLPTGRGEATSVVEICDHYLDHVKINKSQKTFKDAKTLLDEFCKSFGNTTVAQLRIGGKAKILNWVKGHSAWGPSTVEHVCKRLNACFNYATPDGGGMGIIDSSPIKGLNGGQGKIVGATRTGCFSEQQIKTIMALAARSTRCPQFLDAFKMLLGTGCRPEEFCSLTANDVKTDANGNTYWLVAHKNQNKRKWGGKKRPVYLLDAELEQMTLAAVKAHPTGPIFRNGWGIGWTKGSLLQNLYRICQMPEAVALGLNQFELSAGGKKIYEYVPYTCRHTFAHRMIKAGLSYERIADLMGNSAHEVERTYGKIERSTSDFVANFKNGKAK